MFLAPSAFPNWMWYLVSLFMAVTLDLLVLVPEMNKGKNTRS